MADKSLEAQMQEMVDREAIRNLPLQYCHCVWQQDLDGYVNLFTEDGSFSTDDPSLPGAQGQDGLRTMIEGGLAMQPRPFIHNHVIELQRAGPGHGDVLCGSPHEPRGQKVGNEGLV